MLGCPLPRLPFHGFTSERSERVQGADNWKTGLGPAALGSQASAASEQGGNERSEYRFSRY